MISIYNSLLVLHSSIGMGGLFISYDELRSGFFSKKLINSGHLIIVSVTLKDEIDTFSSFKNQKIIEVFFR